jgi:4-alpha-glucanotransferase
VIQGFQHQLKHSGILRIDHMMSYTAYSVSLRHGEP